MTTAPHHVFGPRDFALTMIGIGFSVVLFRL